jgi:hypothetical protein
MRSGLLFTLTAGGLSILFLEVSAQFIKALSDQLTSYMFWIFIVCTIIGMMIFPFAVVLIRPLSISRFWKILIYLALGLLILNFPFGAQDNRWITIDTIRDLIHPVPDLSPDLAYTAGVFHLAPLFAFGLSLFLFRNRLLRPLPGPPAASK